MKRHRPRRPLTLAQKYPPSEPCACPICVAYCRRPGWWTVAEAKRALEGGLGMRMMLEIAPDRSLAVLAPAFHGCGGGVATNEHAALGCGFLTDGRCDLHATPFAPLECRFCHHDRQGLGAACHADLERDWSSRAGRELIERWCVETRFHERYRVVLGPPPT